MNPATYNVNGNVNGVNGRLPVLLRGLAEARPDVVALQELKSPDTRFPAEAVRAAGHEAIRHGQSSWNGVAILSRVVPPVETRRGSSGDPDPAQSRHLWAAVVGVPYLRDGNPKPEPRFDHELA